jgi:hypothetical protein
MCLQTDKNNIKYVIIETVGFCLKELRKSTETLGLVLQSDDRRNAFCPSVTFELAAVRLSFWNAVMSSGVFTAV